MRTSLWTIYVTALATALLLPCPALATCGGPTSFCQKLPDRADKNSAIFLGVVRQVAPPPPSERNPPSAIIPEGRRRVGDPAPAVEIRYPTARFQVVESFLGTDLGEFEVRLSSDHFANGIPQQVPPLAEGEIWLVEAYRDARDQQWTTSFCQRTKPVVEAQEDLRVLRTWISGHTLPARLDGEIFNSAERRSVAGVRVELRGERQPVSSVTDNGGHFAFENLAPGIYEAAATLPRGGGSIKIDLTHAWCAHAVFVVK